VRIFIVIFLIFPILLNAQPSENAINRVMTKVNLLRASGCKCGNKTMRPVNPVVWDTELYVVSQKYATYMEQNEHFDHITKDGKDLGDRLELKGYDWYKVGENLGYGYRDFNEVLQAWKKSPSHCRMLMDPDVTHMGLSKRGKYWVQSFALPSEPSFTGGQ